MINSTTVVMAAAIVFFVSDPVQAQLPNLPHLVYEDTFSHDDGDPLAATSPEVHPGFEKWSSPVTYTISGGKAELDNVANSADVKYLAPTDRKFSIEAVASDRDLMPTNNNIALGFADETGTHLDGFNPDTPPGQNISGRTSLNLTIDGDGNIYLWENAFNVQVASGMTLVDVGLTVGFQGDIPMKLEMDPVTDRAVAEVNGTIVYDIAFDIDSDATCTVPTDPCRFPITWAGFGWSGADRTTGAWDNFAIREADPGPSGACTLPDTSCSILSAADCSSTGGTHVAGVVCPPATLPVVIYEDTFSHDEGSILGGTLPEIGPVDEEWSSPVTHEIFEGKANFRDVENSADVKYLAPTDRKFSIEAVASECDVGGVLTPNHNIALGFADSTPTSPGGDPGVFQPEVAPGQNISGRTGLTLTIDGNGIIHLWENAFWKQVATGATLPDVGLAVDFEGDIPMRLEMDPVNDKAVAIVNNIVVYDIDFDIDSDSTCNVAADPCRFAITWAGFGWSGAGRIQGAWDNFRVREETGTPTGACDLPGGAGGGSCLVLTEAQCGTQGGAYQGDGTSCPAGTSNIPGDCNQDGAFDLSDVICLLGHLFQGNPSMLPCSTTAGNLLLMDCNNDGGVDLSDAIYKLNFLFQGGLPPVQGQGCVPMADCPQNTGCP